MMMANTGALIYFIRRCLHDYDDDVCVEILKNLADALPEDEPRARILINDHIVTDPPDRRVAAMDIMMLTWASLERTSSLDEVAIIPTKWIRVANLISGFGQ